MSEQEAGAAGGQSRHIVLFGTEAAGRELAIGLEETDHRVMLLGPDASMACHLDSLAEGTAVLEAATQRLGGIDAMVWAWVDPIAGQQRPLADTSPAEWASIAEEPLHRMMLFLKLAHLALRDGGGRVILLVPSLAMSGASGLVPWSTVAEGQRSIAKAVARKWGELGITVNSIAVPASLLVPADPDRPLDRPGLPPMSLRPPTLRNDVAQLIASLLTPAWGSVTGTTIGADGGRWMTP